MLSCAETCRTSADLLLIGSPVHRPQCAACARSCREVGEMDVCVAACRTCERTCRVMAA